MNKPLTIFMLVKTTTAWLALAPAKRFAYFDDAIKPILKRHPAVKLRFFDVEAYNARVSDMLMWETTDPAQYQSLVEGLRETLFWDHYFQIVEILPAIEEGYADHYDEKTISARMA
jgi:Darcynin, domain of unknown function